MAPSQEEDSVNPDETEGNKDQQPKDPGAKTWAAAAHKRRGGRIGNGLLHSIETRLGSIA